jgi:hypothetical protein
MSEINNISEEQNSKEIDLLKERKDKIINYGASSKLQHQQSLQENKQDLQQEQQVDVKPSQINVQRFELTLNNKPENYTSSISGFTYLGDDSTIGKQVDIFLYFGTINLNPVCKTKSDEYGYYNFSDLPPGFYSIKASYLEKYEIIISNIKILYMQNADISLWLKYITSKEIIERENGISDFTKSQKKYIYETLLQIISKLHG